MSACSLTASTTRAAVWPTFITPMPPPKSMKVLPSTSVRRAPFASWANIGVAIPTPDETARCRRSINARLFGPGISVLILVDSSIFGTSSCRPDAFQYTRRYRWAPVPSSLSSHALVLSSEGAGVSRLTTTKTTRLTRIPQMMGAVREQPVPDHKEHDDGAARGHGSQGARGGRAPPEQGARLWARTGRRSGDRRPPSGHRPRRVTISEITSDDDADEQGRHAADQHLVVFSPGDERRRRRRWRGWSRRRAVRRWPSTSRRRAPPRGRGR